MSVRLWFRSLSTHHICNKIYLICGKIPPKEADNLLWEILNVDLIVTQTDNIEGKKTFLFKCLMMIGPSTGWFGIVE